MNKISKVILTLNGGSSSIRFALYETEEKTNAMEINETSRDNLVLRRLLTGKIDRVGLKGTLFSVQEGEKQNDTVALDAKDHRSATNFLLNWLKGQNRFESIEVVGHRVVHGMHRSEPECVTPQLLEDLRKISPFDSEHLPLEIDLIETLLEQHPDLPQVVCFDTAFHRTMPRIAKLLPIPRRYEAVGVERYGFHGLSYTYLMEELVGLKDPTAAKGRVILAHLGNGASLAAVKDGKSLDTTMGFTPTSGLVMSNRSGDLDPGLIGYLAEVEKMTVRQFQKMVTHESGLKGISETSSDVRDLLALESSDVRAKEALAIFCYQAKKGIGSFAAALGGLDTLVFTGGIGENSAPMRARICEGLTFLGIDLDEASNAVSAPLISKTGGAVSVRVIPTDEERIIAHSALRILNRH